MRRHRRRCRHHGECQRDERAGALQHRAALTRGTRERVCPLARWRRPMSFGRSASEIVFTQAVGYVPKGAPGVGVRGPGGDLLRAHSDEPAKRKLVPELGGRLTALLLLGSVALGTGLTLQIAMNTRMRAFASGPFGAALLSFVVGALALATVLALARAPWPGRELAQAPWWTWFGGLMGALYVLGASSSLPASARGPFGVGGDGANVRSAGARALRVARHGAPPGERRPDSGRRAHRGGAALVRLF